ncbi:hypothetical protein U3516DRAFT_765790 [Neocallimastix sp. 'constans']
MKEDFQFLLVNPLSPLSSSELKFISALLSFNFMLLPITQHSRIWDLYKKIENDIGREITIRIWRRYLKFDSNNTEDYIYLLLNMNSSMIY